MITISIGIMLAAVSMFAKARVVDEWFGPDKPKHLLASFAAGVASCIILGLFQPIDIDVAFALAMVPGITKEIYDMRPGGSGWSYKDLAADAVGALFGVLWTSALIGVI